MQISQWRNLVAKCVIWWCTLYREIKWVILGNDILVMLCSPTPHCSYLLLYLRSSSHRGQEDGRGDVLDANGGWRKFSGVCGEFWKHISFSKRMFIKRIIKELFSIQEVTGGTVCELQQEGAQQRWSVFGETHWWLMACHCRCQQTVRFTAAADWRQNCCDGNDAGKSAVMAARRQRSAFPAGGRKPSQPLAPPPVCPLPGGPGGVSVWWGGPLMIK